MTPNYIDSSSLSVAPWCDCNNSGNDLEECFKFLNFFKDNTCLSEFKKKKKEGNTSVLSSLCSSCTFMSLGSASSLSLSLSLSLFLSLFFLISDGESSISWPHYAMQQGTEQVSAAKSMNPEA